MGFVCTVRQGFCCLVFLVVSVGLLVLPGCGLATYRFDRPALRLEGKVVDQTGKPLSAKEMLVGFNLGYTRKEARKEIRTGDNLLPKEKALQSGENGCFSWTAPAEKIRFCRMFICFLPVGRAQFKYPWEVFVVPNGEQKDAYLINIKPSKERIQHVERFRRLPKGTKFSVQQDTNLCTINCTFVLKTNKVEP